jgi:hypothetical protein
MSIITAPPEQVAAPPIYEEAQEQHQEQGAALLDQIVSAQATTAYTRSRAEEFEFAQRRAKLYAASGLFRDKKADATTALAQTMVKIDLGESLGFTPAQSLQGVHVINGATAISSALRADRMMRFGYSWDIEWIEGKGGECEGCRLWLKHQGKPMIDRKGQPVSEAFTKADALKMLTTLWDDKGGKRRASILEKENWQMSPRNMYFARAVTNAQRFYAPHVLSAALPSVEEAMDFENEMPMEEPAIAGTRAKLDALKAGRDASAEAVA